MVYYVVTNGRIPGVYTKWSDVVAQISKFEHANYRQFPNEKQAVEFFNMRNPQLVGAFSVYISVVQIENSLGMFLPPSSFGTPPSADIPLVSSEKAPQYRFCILYKFNEELKYRTCAIPEKYSNRIDANAYALYQAVSMFSSKLAIFGVSQDIVNFLYDANKNGYGSEIVNKFFDKIRDNIFFSPPNQYEEQYINMAKKIAEENMELAIEKTGTV